MEFLKLASAGMPLVLHSDAFSERRINIPGVGVSPLPGLNETKLREAGAIIQKISRPSTIASDTILVSGEVERVTPFEKGFPMAEARINDQWVLDPFKDDLGIAVNIKNKGLVVVSGMRACWHSKYCKASSEDNQDEKSTCCHGRISPHWTIV